VPRIGVVGAGLTGSETAWVFALPGHDEARTSAAPLDQRVTRQSRTEPPAVWANGTLGQRVQANQPLRMS
jgi:folate-dependent tRNA-U54 methylase TrmFO/GidA